MSAQDIETLKMAARYYDAASHEPTAKPALSRVESRLARLEEGLRLIRDGRCSCGGRFKWNGNQTRCEQCDRHEGYGVPEHYGEMARSLLADQGGAASRVESGQ